MKKPTKKDFRRNDKSIAYAQYAIALEDYLKHKEGVETDSIHNSQASTKQQQLDAIQNIEFDASAEGCGLEDVGITDRYEAMEHGYQCGLDAAYEAIKNL